MGERLGRRLRRVCFVAAAMCLLLALAAPSSQAQGDDDGPRPEVFRGMASSQVASVQIDRDALLPVPELFRFIALDGAGTYETNNRQARASLLFPGNGLILGPSLACGSFGGQFPPQFKPILDACLQYKYPLTVFADDFAPDGATSGSLALGAPNDPVSANAVRAKAHAGEDATTTDAVLQDLRVLGLPAIGPVTPQIPGFEMDTSLITVDSATSRTNQRIVKGALVVDAEATLSGVRLIGGLIRISSLRSVSHVVDDAAGKRVSNATLEMAGVTVGGVPAQITNKGLVLGPDSGGSGPLAQQQQSQANEMLRNLNIKFSILDSEETTAGKGLAVASVGGLLVEFARDVQGLPTIPSPAGELDPNGLYTGSFLLGATAAGGSAVTFGLDPLVVDDSDVFDGGGFDSGSFDFGDATGVAGVDLPGFEASGPSKPASPAAPADLDEGRLARSVGDFFGDRLSLVYLALMFAVLGCCIAPAFTVPARFAGRNS